MYLMVGWFFGHWIGDRPLLNLSILAMIIGLQFIFFGLLAEIIVNSARHAAPSIAAVLDRHAPFSPVPHAHSRGRDARPDTERADLPR
jgi:hypothetical protein